MQSDQGRTDARQTHVGSAWHIGEALRGVSVVVLALYQLLRGRSGSDAKHSAASKASS